MRERRHRVYVDVEFGNGAKGVAEGGVTDNGRNCTTLFRCAYCVS